jgi:hypothetical protein
MRAIAQVETASLIAVLLCVSCGGGGDHDTGTLALTNASARSKFNGGNCTTQFTVTPVGSDDSRFENLSGCGSENLKLNTGDYNVEAFSPGNCNGAYRQTVTVRKNQVTPLTLTCSNCSTCPGF